MATEQESRLELQIAHVLLIDVVGYSKLLVNEQIEILQLLTTLVRNTAQFRAAEEKGKLTRLPTGDGMALLFFENAESPVECALQISQAVRDHPQLHIRMGIHSGPIKEVADVNDRANFAGAGINLAQRVLDCGDAGHILLSGRVAEDLRSYRHWHPYLHDLGVCEVKHGVKIHLFNLCKDDLGNCALPAKVREAQAKETAGKAGLVNWALSHRQLAATAALIIILALAAVAAWTFRQVTKPSSAKSIAVLPFANSSEEKADTPFVDGMQEDILIDLGKVADLKVISRGSVMQFKPGTTLDLRAIAKDLGVSHILQGTVQRFQNRVRIYVQLIDVLKNQQVWSNRYDRELADVFAIQTEIAGEIVSQLKATFSPKEKAAVQDRPTSDMDAYDLYVRAKAAIESSNYTELGQEDLLTAVNLLNQAVARDPSFFLAYYQLADAHDQLYLRFDHTPARLALASTAVSAMQNLRPTAGETHLAQAKHLYWGYFDYDGARVELKEAQALLPNDPLPPLLTGYIDRRQNRWDNALQNLNRSLELDPRNTFVMEQISLAYFALHRYPEMENILDRALRVDPTKLNIRLDRAAIALEWKANTRPLHEAIESTLAADPTSAATFSNRWIYLALCERDAAHAQRAFELLGMDGCYSEAVTFPRSWCEGMVARCQGDEAHARDAFQRALKESEAMLERQPDFAETICAIAMASAVLGEKEKAITAARRAVELVPVSKNAIDGAIYLEYLAIVYAWVGEKDLALDTLESALKIPTYLSYGNLRLHPYWDPLRKEPRFEEIVQSLAPPDAKR